MGRAGPSAEKTVFWGQPVLWLCRSLMLAGCQCSGHSALSLGLYWDSLAVLSPVEFFPVGSESLSLILVACTVVGIMTWAFYVQFFSHSDIQ